MAARMPAGGAPGEHFGAIRSAAGAKWTSAIEWADADA
jgi:hypothetical protein